MYLLKINFNLGLCLNLMFKISIILNSHIIESSQSKRIKNTTVLKI